MESVLGLENEIQRNYSRDPLTKKGHTKECRAKVFERLFLISALESIDPLKNLMLSE
jgi:hypothetical protein